ncbi:MAG: DUF692 domain-containing protein [Pseudohongiellaceae bacterium]
MPDAHKGFGLGLRRPHYQHVLEQRPAVDWFEVITENFLAPGGRPRDILRRVRDHYPIVLHGLSFNVGADEPMDTGYLDRLKALIEDIEPVAVSDHLCWTGLDGHTSHDLLPIAYSEETLALVSERVERIQEYLNRPILLENPSIYLQFDSATLGEAEFINALTRRTGCGLLLDVNNVHVSGFNLGFDPQAYVDTLDPDSVRQFHLAGHTHKGDHIIDTHDHPVADPVWALYRHACTRFGAVPTLLERDDDIPPFPVLEAELQQARAMQQSALDEAHRGTGDRA